MRTSVSFYDFCRAFETMGRNDNFSYAAKRILFDYLEELEADTGEEFELDVIALCCDYNEETWQTIADEYNVDLDGCDDDDERQERVREYLTENTSLCGEADGSFVFAAF